MSATPLLPLAVAALLVGCATPPQVVRSGDPAFARGKTVALRVSEATPSDRTQLDQASTLVLEKLQAQEARVGDPTAADYLMQVAFSALPKGVGVMRDSAGSWLSQPRRRMGMRSPGYAVSITAIEARTGKAAFSATATGRAHGDPAKAVDRLVTAALGEP